MLANQISKLRSYDPATKVAGPMLGDAMLLNIESQMRRLMSASVSGVTGPYTSLASLGITSTTNGTLSVDSAKLQAALTANPDCGGRSVRLDQRRGGTAVQLSWTAICQPPVTLPTATPRLPPIARI